MYLKSILAELAKYVEEFKAAESSARRWYQAYLDEKTAHAATRQDLDEALGLDEPLW